MGDWFSSKYVYVDDWYAYCKWEFIGKWMVHFYHGRVERIWVLKPTGLVFETWFWLCDLGQVIPNLHFLIQTWSLYLLCRIVTKLEMMNIKNPVHSKY